MHVAVDVEERVRGYRQMSGHVGTLGSTPPEGGLPQVSRLLDCGYSYRHEFETRTVGIHVPLAGYGVDMASSQRNQQGTESVQAEGRCEKNRIHITPIRNCVCGLMQHTNITICNVWLKLLRREVSVALRTKRVFAHCRHC